MKQGHHARIYVFGKSELVKNEHLYREDGRKDTIKKEEKIKKALHEN
jgi:hypothetical protein